ncbi:ecdysone oxidase-like [Leguminivora glycinivorella]|uniref:ecdysone oxidase-like n=1 Tax=Leguminivora glycinivorella TaxID=1035111 RepID=UPI00200F0FBE|nr:ecdysone oxidase-like [Leguminivora glycinivorella]
MLPPWLFLLALARSSVALVATDLPRSVNLKDGQEFDYIVVGGGGGGVPAASRLALAGYEVLLVEAGDDPNILSDIPSGAQALLGSNIDWQYPTIPNNVSCLASRDNNACRFSRGKCLGGSTSINYMMYTRGNPRDFDDLAIDGWAWEDVRPYFLKYEGLQVLDELPPTSAPYHNTNGTMKVGFFTNSENSWHDRIIRSLQLLDFPFNPNVNAQSQIGVTQVVGYVHKGTRMSTARGYLTRKDVKKALKVAKRTRCTGVILDDNNKAKGIKVITQKNLDVLGLLKKEINLYVRKEVILSAGTIGTPQILMLSGIGHADHLKSLGIPVRVDLPVGDNMSDHVLPLCFIQADPGPGIPVLNPFVIGLKGVQGVQWIATKDGPLASNGLTDATALANTKCYDFEQRKLTHNSSDCELPTLQLINAFVDRNLLQSIELIVQNAVGLKLDVVRQLSAANVHKALMAVSPVVLRPYSRGTIRLKSTDPTDVPAIFPNYLGDERDIEEMLRSITILEHLVETPEYKAHNASMLHLKFDGCPEYEEDRVGYWTCFCRHMTYSVFHAVGTAALGPVLDEQLRVRGVDGLRVADLSAMPELPRANTAATAIALGERVADFILNGNVGSNDDYDDE